MTDRHALLIGVPNCDEDLFEALPHIVSADIARMTDALGQSGYEVRHCGTGSGSLQEPTGNRIRAGMMQALRDAPPGGILLVYFSGHGVNLDGKSYLVPQDVYSGPDGPVPESLVPLVPRQLGECRARLVLFVVDACRNDLADGPAELSQSDTLPYPVDGAFVLLNSCRPGERSTYGADGSYFTEVLAEVLDRRHPARTLGDVHDALARGVARKAATTDSLQQTPDLVLAQRGNLVPPPRQVAICDGDQVGEAWRRAIEETALWQRTSIDTTDIERIRNDILSIVDECSQHWLDAQSVLHSRAQITDPWAAQDCPVRVLAAVDSCLPHDADLTAIELAALIAAPFVREAALSTGIRIAATVEPVNFTRTYHDGPRSDLEITHAMYEHVCRRAEGLDRRGRTAPRDALAMWLVHQWLAAQPALWSDPAVTNQCNRLARLTAGLGTAFTERELCSTLPILIRCVDSGTDGKALVGQLRRRVFDRRLRSLGAILWLAGVMAADPRRVPTVVVDHVGIGAEVQIPALHAAAVKANWQRTGDILTLHAVCDHPALLAAFTNLVERTEQARQWIEHLDVAPELTNSLPARFSDAGLRPENHEGAPVFDTPLLRFRLSDEKVRELLMGRQLYGEPDLAIRELYQNALDACRYRHIRRRYRQRQGGTTTGWTGAIAFRQDTDSDGREFIECTDNGVGMGHDTLMSTFANAGERFVYRSGFRAEQARWQELNPPLQLVPNSQFGVGVFSYFMIAEEIHIVTRPINEDDVVDPQAHSVRIASSGSLFQITPSTEMPAGGTRIRLYLTGEDRLSVVRTLRRLLWIAEYAVMAEEEGGSRETWQPEKLRYPDAIVEPLQYGDDLWWVPGEGRLTADGIRTNENRYGLVVNLRGPRRPQFTVDRNRLRHWDKEWIREQIQGSLAVLQNWPGLTLSWLWSVTETTPSVAEDVFTWLLAHERELAVEGAWGRATAPVNRVGCLPVDRELFTGEMFLFFDAKSRAWLTAWRVGTWKGISRFAGAERIPEATRLDGFPVVRPLDGNILSGIYERGRYFRSPSRWGQPTADELLETLADPDESPDVRLRRLRRYAITGLDLRAARRIPPIAHVFTIFNERLTENTEEKNLISAVAAWSPPGAQPRSAVGLCLATASASLRIPLGEVLRRAAALVPASWTPPINGDLGDLGDHVFTWSETELFAEEFLRFAPPIGPVISPAQIVQISSKLGQPISQVLKMFDRFAPLGYQVAGRALYPGDPTNVEQAALRYAEEFGYELTPLHLLLLASQVETTVEQVCKDLRRITEIGFIGLPAATPSIDVATDDEQVIIANDLNVYDERVSRFVVATGWVATRELIREIGGRDFHDFDKRLSRRQRLLDVVDLHRPITAPEIVELAYYLDYSIAAAVDHYRFLYRTTADLSCLPDAGKNWGDIYPRHEETIALLGANAQRYGVHEVSWSLRSGDIVNGAREAGQTIASFLDRLEPYRSLGAPLPDLTQTERDLLSVHVADRYDQFILAEIDRYGRMTFVDTVDALRLIQVSGRLGWTPSETHARIAPWQPLGLELNYSPEACFDDIVSWQDLLLITEHLDGQAPAITGRVSEAHLRTCAAEIDESIEQVLARLRRYAPLFDLEVEQEDADVR